MTDQIADALAAQRGALELYEALGDGVKAGDMLRWISRLSYLDARIDDARAAARRAVEILEEFPATLELGLAYANMAHLAQIDLDIEAALSWGERALAIGEELGAQQLPIDVLLTMGISRGARRPGHRTPRAQPEAGTRPRDRRLRRPGLRRSRLRRGAKARLGGGGPWLAEGIRYSTERDLDSRRLYLLGWRAAASLERGPLG